MVLPSCTMNIVLKQHLRHERRSIAIILLVDYNINPTHLFGTVLISFDHLTSRAQFFFSI